MERHSRPKLKMVHKKTKDQPYEKDKKNRESLFVKQFQDFVDQLEKEIEHIQQL